MADVHFEEDAIAGSRTHSNATPSAIGGMRGLLIRTSLAKDGAEADRILIGVIIVLFLIAGFLVLSSLDSFTQPSQKQALTPPNSLPPYQP